MGTMEIRIDDLSGPEIAGLLQEHVDDMRRTSPPESTHVLELDELRKPEITFWCCWNGDRIAGCGALKELSADHAEIKSMRTAAEFRRQGVGNKILQHMLEYAKGKGHSRVSLETGSMEFFDAAQKLYLNAGFEVCGPFADYVEDPNSIYMTMEIGGESNSQI